MYLEASGDGNHGGLKLFVFAGLTPSISLSDLKTSSYGGFPNANIYFINFGLDIITMIIPRK